MQQQPSRKSMTSTMTTIAMVFMGALTANASMLRLKGSNSPVTSKESSSADTSLHEAGKANYSSDAMPVGFFGNTIDQQVNQNDYNSYIEACDACYAHSSESNGAKTVGSVQALTNAIGRKCACLAFKKGTVYKMYCAKQKYDGAGRPLDGYTESDATNTIAGLSGCQCTRASACTGDNCGMHKDSAEACQKWAATNRKPFDFRCSSMANPTIHPNWCSQRLPGCWRETGGHQRVFFNAGEKHVASQTGAIKVADLATTTTCPAMGPVTSLPRRRRTSYGTGRTPLYCPETMVGTGPKNADYRGCQSKTRSGRTCQAWSSQTPHKHSAGCAQRPSGGVCTQPLPNACRNPDGSATIWCYTVSSLRWEYCDARDPTALAITR